MSLIPVDSKLLETYIEVALRNYTLIQNVHLKSYKIIQLGDEMLGLLSEHFKVNVIYKIDKKENEVTFFGKAYPKDNKPKDDFVQQYNMFNRETVIYSKIISEFDKIAPQTWHAKCFLVTNDLLMFEDLSLKGFRMFELRQTQDRAHCLVGLTSIARFHSATVFYEEFRCKSTPNYRLQDEFEPLLKKGCLAFNSFTATSRKIGLKMAELSQKYGKNTPHFDKVCKQWENVINQGIQLLVHHENERTVLNHVDLWNNNIMFSYNQDGTPEDCIFVDYQASQFMPPCADIMSYLYMNLNEEMRSNLFQVFIDHYYTELKRILFEKHISVENIFPYNDFTKKCNEYKLWGMIHAIIIFQFVFIENGTVMKMIKGSDNFKVLLSYERWKLVIETMQNDLAFRERILSIIDELIETYIINV